VDNDGNALLTGALYFNSVASEMRVYDGSAWKAAGSAINGTTRRQSFTATAAQTTFTVTGGYDAGFADVYLNGVKLVNGTDVNVSSGTDVVLTVGAAAGDSVDVVAYGAFSLANAVAKTGDTMNGSLIMGAVGNNILFPRGIDNTTSLVIRSQSGGNELQLVNDSGSTGNMVAIGNGVVRIQTENTERARIDSSGHLVQAAGCRIFSPGTYNNTTGAAANMGVDAAAGVFYRSTSSLKYKRDVSDYNKGLEAVMQLRPVYYKGTSDRDGETQYAGLIAEEVHEEGLTEFVQYAEDGTPDALAYGNMVALAFKAIQEQQAIIEQLKARVEALEGAAE